MLSRRVRTILVMATALLVAITGCSSAEGGPIEEFGPQGYGGIVLDVGQEMTDGFNSIVISGAEDDVVIKKIELVDSPAELEIVGTLIGFTAPEYQEQFEKEFPPTEPKLGEMEQAIGFTLEGSADPSYYSLLIGMKATKTGKFLRGGYKITYESGGETYTRTAPAEVTICTSDHLDADGECALIESEY